MDVHWDPDALVKSFQEFIDENSVVQQKDDYCDIKHWNPDELTRSFQEFIDETIELKRKKEIRAKWISQNKDKIREHKKKWYIKNKEKIKEKNKQLKFKKKMCHGYIKN